MCNTIINKLSVGESWRRGGGWAGDKRDEQLVNYNKSTLYYFVLSKKYREMQHFANLIVFASISPLGSE